VSSAVDPGARAAADVDDVLDPGLAVGPLAALLRPARAAWDAVGVDDALVAPQAAQPVVAALLAERAAPLLVVTPRSADARAMADALGALLGEGRVEVFPAWGTLPSERLSPQPATVGRRLAVVDRIARPDAHPEPLLPVVAPVRAALQPMDPRVAQRRPLELAPGPAFSYLFVYGERVLGASAGLLALLVVLAGPAGLVGILLGRAAADRIGRNLAAGVSMAGTGAAVAWAYGGTAPRLAIGYLLAIMASSAFAPPTGALGAELVPTRIRATLAGWITFAGVLGAVVGIAGFGVLADATGGFDSAARTIGIVTALSSVGFLGLPETRGVELEDLEADA